MIKPEKSKKEKTFFSLNQIINTYFPSDVRKQKKIFIENPKLLGEHFASKALKQVKLP